MLGYASMTNMQTCCLVFRSVTFSNSVLEVSKFVLKVARVRVLSGVTSLIAGVTLHQVAYTMLKRYPVLYLVGRPGMSSCLVQYSLKPGYE